MLKYNLFMYLNFMERATPLASYTVKFAHSCPVMIQGTWEKHLLFMDIMDIIRILPIIGLYRSSHNSFSCFSTVFLEYSSPQWRHWAGNSLTAFSTAKFLEDNVLLISVRQLGQVAVSSRYRDIKITINYKFKLC